MYLNKAIIIGNLTRDPEVRALPNGMKVCSFSVATNRVWKDQNGARQEAADYHNIVVFGRQAETVGQYMKKGSSILVEGRMQTRSWDDKDGVKKYRTEIIADKTQFGPKGSASTGGSNQTVASNEGPRGVEENMDTIDYPEEDINPEDIPF
jgi:single-strand DNA-binding protein